MLSAVELGVFTALSDGPATEPELRARLGLHPRGSLDFLDTLVALNVLERDGDRYRNAPDTDYYLDKNKPTYLGYPEWVVHGSFHSWTRFTDSLRTGLRQSPRGNAGGDLFDLYDDPDEIARTMAGADTHNTALARALAAEVDWSGYRDFVDIGGARGNVPALLVRAHPHLHGMNFDLPVIKPYFDAHMAQLGMSPAQVSFESGDFFVDTFPTADVMICGHTLHNHSVETRKLIIAKAYEALRPGGIMLAYDVLLDEQRAELVPLMWSLSMLVQTAEGAEYTISECQSWMLEAGFDSVSSAPLGQFDKLVIGHKRA
jgi:O-methyltransferase domain/Dimerisation domain